MDKFNVKNWIKLGFILLIVLRLLGVLRGVRLV